MPYTPIEDGDISKTTNRFTSQTGTVYDEAGQVVTDNKFRNITFAYDANGRQVKAIKANVPDAQTVYDALGNRVATKIYDVWQYVIYDAFGKLVAEYGIASEGLGGVKYIQQDWQGSVRTVTNNSGFVVARTDHQAFGEEIGLGVGMRSLEQGYSADKTTRQGYGLTENDESSGQQHAWFRKLEQKAGRWTSPDPYKGSMSLGDPQSFNRFSYVTNDPLNFVDPSGLDEEDDGEIIRIYINDSYLEALLWLYFGGLGRELYQPIGVTGDPPGVPGGLGPSSPPPGQGDDPREERCKGIIAKANRLIQLFLKEWKKYNPDSDAIGGFPTRGGRTTKPFGHWIEMKDLQNGMRKQAELYDRNCNDRNDGRGGRGGTFPQQARSLSNQFIPRKAGPSMFENMGMSPEAAAKASAYAAGAAAVVYVLWLIVTKTPLPVVP